MSESLAGYRRDDHGWRPTMTRMVRVGRTGCDWHPGSPSPPESVRIVSPSPPPHRGSRSAGGLAVSSPTRPGRFRIRGLGGLGPGNLKPVTVPPRSRRRRTPSRTVRLAAGQVEVTVPDSDSARASNGPARPGRGSLSSDGQVCSLPVRPGGPGATRSARPPGRIGASA
jgi:hypothetical protein